MIHIVFYGIFIDYDLSGAAGQPIEAGEGKREEIEQAASESRHLADELAGMLDRLEIEEERSAAVNAVVPGEQEVVEGDDDGRGGASKAEEIVENPFFTGLDEEGSKGLPKREAKDQGAKEEAEELKEREEEERTRKEHEAEQRVEEEAERQAREREVSCLGIQQNRPSVIMAARSRKRAIEDETNNKDAALKLSDDDVSPAVLEKSEKERMDRARMMEEMLRDHYQEKSEEKTTANGHVRGIKEEITLVED